MSVYSSSTTTYYTTDNRVYWYHASPSPKKIIIHNAFPKRRNLRFLSKLNPRRWTPNIDEAVKFSSKDLGKVKNIIEEIRRDFERADWTVIR